VEGRREEEEKRKKKRRRRGEEEESTYRADVAIKAGVVSFENVAFLKVVRPVVLDVL